MSNASGYIRRLKSLSLIVLGATLLTYDVADSGVKLGKDFTQAETLFLITQLTHSRAPGNGIISKVNGIPAADWLQSIELTLPEMGDLINIINSWKKPALSIEGKFKLSNGEYVEFSRLPVSGFQENSATKGSESRKVQELCIAERDVTCHFYSLRKDEQDILPKALLVYGLDREQATSTRKKSWRYYSDDDGDLVTIDQAESRVIRLALPWIGAAQDAESAYLKLREKLEQRTVRIPVLNLDVKSTRVALFLSLFSLVVAALMTHSLLAIGNLPVKASDEPWILLMPGNYSKDWAGRLQKTLSFGGGALITALIWCPLVIVGLTINMSQSTLLVGLQGIIIAVTAIAAAASTLKILSILSIIHETEE